MTLAAAIEQTLSELSIKTQTPLQTDLFTTVEQERKAARRRKGLFVLSDRTELTLTGKDRASFLHGFCTNDINKLPVGHSCEAFITSIKGRALGHVWVTAFENRLLLEGSPNQSETLLPHLKKYIIMEDVQLEETSTSRDLLYLVGPETVDLIAKLNLVIDVVHRGMTVTIAANELLGCEDHGDVNIDVIAQDWLGEPGLLFRVPCEVSGLVWQKLVELNAEPCGRETWERMRVESKFPHYGQDITEQNICQEVGRTEQAISFRKGCYLGQEPIARLDALGHVNKELTLLQIACDSDTTLDDLTATDVILEESEKSLGQLSSIVFRPDYADALALCYLRNAGKAADAKLLLQAKDGRCYPVQVLNEPQTSL